MGWGRVTRGWLAWGVLAGQAGVREVGPDWGRRGDSGRLDWLIGNFAGAGGRVSLRPRFRLAPEWRLGEAVMTVNVAARHRFRLSPE